MWTQPTSCSKNRAFSCPLDQKSMAYASSFMETILILRKFPTNTTLSIFWKKKMKEKQLNHDIKITFSNRPNVLCITVCQDLAEWIFFFKWSYFRISKMKSNKPQNAFHKNMRGRIRLGEAETNTGLIYRYYVRLP